MTLRRAVLAALIAVLTWPMPAWSLDCPVKGEGGGCKVPLGEYFVRTPPQPNPVTRAPIVMLLHDAGQDGGDLTADDQLMAAFIERGYAVIVPQGEKRKYVRGTRGLNSVVSRNKSKFPMLGTDGKLRDMRAGSDTGWYFRNVDMIRGYKEDPISEHRKDKPVGRDEEAFLQQVLFDAGETYRVDPARLTIVGLGHGAALTWQIACRSPDTADMFAPVNGAYWLAAPEACNPGAKVIHTHEKDNVFWPLEGRARARKRYPQAAIDDVIEAVAGHYGCETKRRKVDIAAAGYESRDWSGCTFGGSIRLNTTDGQFDFPDWWLDQVLAGSDGTNLPTSETGGQDGPGLAKPRFMKPRFMVKP